jgi:hypothetical protein
MLAYVFWHWPVTGAENYAQSLIDFHDRLSAYPPERFLGSTTARISGAPWLVDSEEVFEDWYFVEDFAALGLLNEAAPSEARQAQHDEVARLAEGGSGGLYALRSGEVLGVAPAISLWFAKPSGVSYRQLHAALEEALFTTPHALWQRQMVLGPGPEYCLHATTDLELPTMIAPLPVAAQALFPGE